MLVYLLILSTIGFCRSETSLSGVGNVADLITTLVSDRLQNNCMPDVNCFNPPSSFFHLLLLLLSSKHFGTQFLLYTPSNSQNGEKILASPESIKSSSLDSRLPLKVVVHGYATDLKVGDVRFQMKDALLKANNLNVIIVNWTDSNGPSYLQAFANVRGVAAQVAKLLRVIMATTGLRAKDIHLIGHSLGAQLCGNVGERIPHISRITGLDPASIMYPDTESLLILDYTDADFVDIIHTDGNEVEFRGFGLGIPTGHMDFYVNGGRRQPGCENKANNSTIFESFVDVNTCDHGRSAVYFIESIEESKCQFLAVKCNSFEDFMKGRCPPQTSIVVKMGYHAKKTPGVRSRTKFYLRTSESSPFCIQKSAYPEDNLVAPRYVTHPDISLFYPRKERIQS